jgi:hypothetical protein
MGFYASRDNRSVQRLRDEANRFLMQFSDTKIRIETLEWLKEQD